MDHIETAILNCYGIGKQNKIWSLLPGSHNTVYNPEHGRSDGPLPSILQSEDRRKHCGASTSNRTEIHGHYVAVVGASRRFLAQIQGIRTK